MLLQYIYLICNENRQELNIYLYKYACPQSGTYTCICNMYIYMYIDSYITQPPVQNIMEQLCSNSREFIRFHFFGENKQLCENINCVHEKENGKLFLF